jgi:hypothetical protein
LRTRLLQNGKRVINDRNNNLSPRRVAVRVVFSIAVTVLIGVAGYLVINWLAHLPDLP